MKYQFGKDQWTMDGLQLAYSARFVQNSQFIQREDCIENPADETIDDGYSYISLVTKEKMKTGTRIVTHCSFEGLAAPLMVVVKDLFERNGVPTYCDYQEVVLWKNGMNVWNLWGQEDGTVVWHKLVGVDAQLEEKKIHELIVDVLADGFQIQMDGQSIYVRDEHLYPEFYIGITGCEGVCKFYDMEIIQQ